MGTTTGPQAETNACGATGSRKGSETRQTLVGGVDRGWSGRARPGVTGALCGGTDEADPTEGEADARGDEAVVWSPPHADAVCYQLSHAGQARGSRLVRRVTQTETATSAATGCSGSARRRWWRNSYGLLTTGAEVYAPAPRART